MADDGIVAFDQLTGVNHDGSMRPMPGLQIPRVAAGHIIFIPTLVGSHFPCNMQRLLLRLAYMPTSADEGKLVADDGARDL